jgi:hypothetical protein
VSKEGVNVIENARLVRGYTGAGPGEGVKSSRLSIATVAAAE